MPPTLQVIQNQLNNYKPDVPVLSSIKNALAGCVNSEEQNHEQAQKGICDEFGPEVLSSSEVLKHPHTLHKLIRDYLVICGLQ
jgi:hypothetical protein